MTPNGPLVAVINATTAAIPPIRRAFSERFPAAILWNLLDDRLLIVADERGGVTPELQERMRRLIDHAVTEGADAVLLSCSLYGFVARQRAANLTVPVHGPDDAVFSSLLDSGARRVLLVGSVEISIQDSTTRLRADAEARGVELDVIPALLAGPDGTIGQPDEAVDAILLAQYSLAPAADRLQDELGVPVFSSPKFAATALSVAIRGHR